VSVLRWLATERKKLVAVLAMINERLLLCEVSYEHKILFEELYWGLDDTLGQT